MLLSIRITHVCDDFIVRGFQAFVVTEVTEEELEGTEERHCSVNSDWTSVRSVAKNSGPFGCGHRPRCEISKLRHETT